MAGKTKKSRVMTHALRILRYIGERPAKVERFSYYAKKYVDLWGMFDLISVAPNGRIRFIQVFSGADYARHIERMREHRQVIQYLLENPLVTVELWGWKGVQTGISRRGFFTVWRWHSTDEAPIRLRLFTNGDEVPYTDRVRGLSA